MPENKPATCADCGEQVELWCNENGYTGPYIHSVATDHEVSGVNVPERWWQHGDAWFGSGPSYIRYAVGTFAVPGDTR